MFLDISSDDKYVNRTILSGMNPIDKKIIVRVMVIIIYFICNIKLRYNNNNNYMKRF
jgi:hypothetical protein